MDIQSLAPHIVIHPADASDPLGYAGLGRYIYFNYTYNHYTAMSKDGIAAADDISQACLDAAQRIFDADDTVICKGMNDVEFIALDAKNDLRSLIAIHSQEEIEAIRTDLVSAAETAVTGSVYTSRVKELLNGLSPSSLESAMKGIGEIFNARFPAPVGRIFIRGKGSFICADFSNATVTESGVAVTMHGETTIYPVRGKEYDIELKIPRNMG